MLNKKINFKDRTVDIFQVRTDLYEDEIVGFLKRHMKVVFHEAIFSNKKYVFTGSPDDYVMNKITVTGFRKKLPNENISVEIG